MYLALSKLLNYRSHSGVGPPRNIRRRGGGPALQGPHAQDSSVAAMPL